MHPVVLAIFMALLLLFVFKFGPLVKSITFIIQLRQHGFSWKQVREILESESRRMFKLAEDMKQACGEPCHERYCDLDPFGDQPHQCHRVGCAGTGD